MNTQTSMDDLLSLLLSGGEELGRPTWHNLDRSFDDWQYRHSIRYQLRRLRKNQWIEKNEDGGQVFYRLSDQGRLIALGGIDPPARWQRPWDGQWRMVLFDVPAPHRTARIRLWRWLRQHRFGFLQKSVWIHPDPLSESSQVVPGIGRDVGSLVVMEARCCPGFSNAERVSNADLVKAAWDFAQINRHYQDYLAYCDQQLQQLRNVETSLEAHVLWRRKERQEWSGVVCLDPFLPLTLLPADYLGQAAWKARQELLSINPWEGVDSSGRAGRTLAN